MHVNTGGWGDKGPKVGNLGVTITVKLDWSPRCNTIASKANRTLGVLRRHLKGCSKSVKSTTYKALVRPQLEYCSSVWDPYHQTDKATLERVQRRAARFVTGDYKREFRITTIINNLGWKTLEERRAASRLTLMYKIINKLVDVDIKNTPLQLLNTQTHRSFPLTYQNLRPNKNCYKCSFFSRTIPEWNSLPVSVRTSNSVNIFNITYKLTTDHSARTYAKSPGGRLRSINLELELELENENVRMKKSENEKSENEKI